MAGGLERSGELAGLYGRHRAPGVAVEHLRGVASWAGDPALRGGLLAVLAVLAIEIYREIQNENERGESESM